MLSAESVELMMPHEPAEHDGCPPKFEQFSLNAKIT